MLNLRSVFGVMGESENLEPAEMQVTPSARMMHCDACQTPTRHEQSPDGHWVCWCGYDANAAAMADVQTLTMIEATAQMFAGMRPQERGRWLSILVELMLRVPGAKQIIIDTVGRYGF